MDRDPRATTESWTVGRLLNWTREHFNAKSVEDPRLSAEVLLAHTLGCSRIELYTRFNDQPNDAERASFRELIKRAALHEPIAYLVGYKEFYSLRFAVSPAVLIPRPETETLVEQAVGWCRTCELETPRILEIGVGSGCVIVSILTQIRDATAFATDTSESAIDVATANANTHGVTDRLEFGLNASAVTFADSLPSAAFDLIVSNPPYIAANEMESLDSTVREYEPVDALTPGDDPLRFYKAIASDGLKYLGDRGAVMVEIGAGMAGDVASVFDNTGGWRHAGTFRTPPDPHERVMHFEKV